MDEILKDVCNEIITDINSPLAEEIDSILEVEKETKALIDPIMKSTTDATSLIKPLSIQSVVPSALQLSSKIGSSYINALTRTADLLPKMDNIMGTYLANLTSMYSMVEKINSWKISFINENNLAIKKIYDSFAKVSTLKTTLAISWLSEIDLNPIQSILSKIHLDTTYWGKYKQLNEAYLNAMYECKWFPYAGWTVDYELFTEVTDILSTSRHGSARREKRIDKAIFSYYTNKEIKNIKRSWNHSDLKPHIKKIIGQAIEAHLRGEYALTITCLSSMWEGLIHDKLHVKGRLGQRKTLEGFKELIDDNNFEDVYSEFYEKLILSQCDEPEDVIDGVPNRNGISHSKYKKYPNKKASLNAILITDFIISLRAKELPEENKDGQTEDAQS